MRQKRRTLYVLLTHPATDSCQNRYVFLIKFFLKDTVQPEPGGILQSQIILISPLHAFRHRYRIFCIPGIILKNNQCDELIFLFRHGLPKSSLASMNDQIALTKHEANFKHGHHTCKNEAGPTGIDKFFMIAFHSVFYISLVTSHPGVNRSGKWQAQK